MLLEFMFVFFGHGEMHLRNHPLATLLVIIPFRHFNQAMPLHVTLGLSLHLMEKYMGNLLVAILSFSHFNQSMPLHVA
jgi:hypothetical protein